MQEKYTDILKPKMDQASFDKLDALDNDKLHAFVADAVGLCKPDSVFVADDSKADEDYIRSKAIESGEESKLATDGHTVHYDGYTDQGRDKSVTKYLLPEGVKLGERLNSMDRTEGLDEVRGYLDGAMAGKQMIVCFYCLGPTDSPFSLSCAQITDSAYVVHSENMLYRSGYEQFKRLDNPNDFFSFCHSTGKVNDQAIPVDTDKKRVYIDITEDTVYTTNTTYAGNTVGLKKLALRLAIRKADRESWLAEHMFVMGVHGPSDRVTYFAGAFPSACGKTSTAMLPGETIIGDDLAYFRQIDGVVKTVNVESGIFGIIRDVNSKDDPEIWKLLHTPGEVIFGNVLVKDGQPYWMGMGQDLPESGYNHAGDWTKGMKGPDGKAVDPSHKNARYTVRISDLGNRDPKADAPEGVEAGGIIYGGRDSDTSVPVCQSFDWEHGIITMGASLESETTAATIGAEGVRAFNIMSNMDFLAIPMGKYIQNNLDFGKGLTKTPMIFGVNYFLKGADGQYLNGMLDKSIWVKWMELRVNGDVETIESPVGLLPKFEDLKKLFADVLDKEYTQDNYIEQFSIRTDALLAKIGRIEKIYQAEADTPALVMETLKAQKGRLQALKAEKGSMVSPMDL